MELRPFRSSALPSKYAARRGRRITITALACFSHWVFIAAKKVDRQRIRGNEILWRREFNPHFFLLSNSQKELIGF